MNNIIKIAGSFEAVLAVVLSIATAASLFARYHWIFDTVANFRVQGLIAVMVLGGLALLLRDWWTFALAAALMLANLSMINFGSMDHAASATGRRPLRIVTTNVLTSNERHDDIIDELRLLDADVIVVIELSTKLAARLRESFQDSHPYQTIHEQDIGNFGIGILSRLPLRSARALPLAGCPLSLEVTVDDCCIIATHPVPPVGDIHFDNRNRQLKKLAAYVRPDLGRPRRTVVVGDLNLTPWNANFTDLLRSAGLRRAAPRWDFRPTWYARPAFPLGLRIDHVLISDDLVCTGFQIGSDCGSDHRSVCVTLHSRAR